MSEASDEGAQPHHRTPTPTKMLVSAPTFRTLVEPGLRAILREELFPLPEEFYRALEGADE
jgi:hypothetical protein